MHDPRFSTAIFPPLRSCLVGESMCHSWARSRKQIFFANDKLQTRISSRILRDQTMKVNFTAGYSFQEEPWKFILQIVSRSLVLWIYFDTHIARISFTRLTKTSATRQATFHTFPNFSIDKAKRKITRKSESRSLLHTVYQHDLDRWRLKISLAVLALSDTGHHPLFSATSQSSCSLFSFPLSCFPRLLCVSIRKTSFGRVGARFTFSAHFIW